LEADELKINCIKLPLSLTFFPEEYVKDAPLGKEMTIPVCKEFFSGNELKQV